MELIGRDGALRALDDVLAAVVVDGGRVALVGGEAGSGKTSVISAFVRRHPDAATWWATCDPTRAPRALAPLFDSARGRGARFGPMLRAGAPWQDLIEAVLDDLHASPTPTILVLDDAQWADAATLDLVRHVARRIHSIPCLLVIAYRDDELGAVHPLRKLWGALPHARVHRTLLPPLTAAAVDPMFRTAGWRTRDVHAAKVPGHRDVVAGARGMRPSTAGNPHQLTTREMEVLKLLCKGLRNSEIAGRLFRSVRTVDHHLEAVFAKLGVGSRTAAVTVALTTGMLEAYGHVRSAG